MSKELVLMRDIICLYHPAFTKSADLRSYGMSQPHIFNVERLIEESLAAIGPYEFVDEEGYDFTDYSDSKTTSINKNTRAGNIGSVETKIGALRITCYNPHKDTADYFFVPKNKMHKVRQPCYGVNSHKERILFTWNHRHDHYNSFDDYRVGSFKELAIS